MSPSPPPYAGNPDRRPLPAGWITQFDPNYKAWFYVNTEAKPPITTWTHPFGPEPPRTPSPERKYSPPMAPPPQGSPSYADRYGPTGPQSYNQGGYLGGNDYPQQPQDRSYGGPRPEYGAGYDSNYPQESGSRGLGGLLGRFSGGRGHHGGHHGGLLGGGGGYPGYQQPSQVVYPGQQPQVAYAEQQPPRRSGMGMGGGLALGAAGGLLGGVLLGEAIEDHRDREEVFVDYNDDGGFGGDLW